MALAATGPAVAPHAVCTRLHCAQCWLSLHACGLHRHPASCARAAREDGAQCPHARLQARTHAAGHPQLDAGCCGRGLPGPHQCLAQHCPGAAMPRAAAAGVCLSTHAAWCVQHAQFHHHREQQQSPGTGMVSNEMTTHASGGGRCWDALACRGVQGASATPGCTGRSSPHPQAHALGWCVDAAARSQRLERRHSRPAVGTSWHAGMMLSCTAHSAASGIAYLVHLLAPCRPRLHAHAHAGCRRTLFCTTLHNP